MIAYPPLLDRAGILARLQLIFAPGTPQRGWVTRELAASAIFTALYVGAVEGADVWFGPVHVYRMTDEQALKTDAGSRGGYAVRVSRGDVIEGRRWYADNTREPIRDETLREGLVRLGAAVVRKGLPTTSGKPRYALGRQFAALFEPDLAGDDLEEAIARYRAEKLDVSSLARIAIVQAGAASGAQGVLVRFPSGETRRLAPGPSSVISKDVVEVFAPRFLKQPAVLWLSESGVKVVHRDDVLARSLGLSIAADLNLPDLILADIGGARSLIVFVEVVATDGPINERRREALVEVSDAAGFARSDVALVTAYNDRSDSAFRRSVPELAWGSYAWFRSEPEHLLKLADRPESLIVR